ncbi:hypothetical protein [Microbacterium sulfonylureivorans]|uniref:hypothetical protein n=1 Tax=Microbacterium sulfonylureivorans TaxID=2486854 RepID=UPI0013E00A79|nr:hypothetical protein [Microbacterium sulfonylureivorans]
MSIVPKSRDGREALLIAVGSFVTAIALWVGFFAFTGYLVDSGDRDLSQTQTD